MIAAPISFEAAADVLTWTDEPELLAQPGQPAPTFTAAQVREARRLSSCHPSAWDSTPPDYASAQERRAYVAAHLDEPAVPPACEPRSQSCPASYAPA